MQVILGFAFGAYLAVDIAIMTLVLCTADSNDRDLEILGFAQTGAQVLSQFVSAFVISFLGGYTALFVFAIVCSVLGGATIIPIRKVR